MTDVESAIAQLALSIVRLGQGSSQYIVLPYYEEGLRRRIHHGANQTTEARERHIWDIKEKINEVDRILPSITVPQGVSDTIPVASPLCVGGFLAVCSHTIVLVEKVIQT